MRFYVQFEKCWFFFVITSNNWRWKEQLFGDIALILTYFLTVYLFAFELENGVTMLPKRGSLLSLLFFFTENKLTKSE